MNTMGGGALLSPTQGLWGKSQGGGGGAWWRHTYQYLPAALPHAWSLATVWLWKPCTAWWSLAVLCSPNPATAAPSDLRQSYTPHTVSSKQTISLTISGNCVTCSSVMQATLNRCSSIRPETVTHITCSAPEQPTGLKASGSRVACDSIMQATSNIYSFTSSPVLRPVHIFWALAVAANSLW